MYELASHFPNSPITLAYRLRAETDGRRSLPSEAGGSGLKRSTPPAAEQSDQIEQEDPGCQQDADDAGQVAGQALVAPGAAAPGGSGSRCCSRWSARSEGPQRQQGDGDDQTLLTDFRSGRRVSARISRALRKAVSPEVMERITTPAKAYPGGKLTRPDPPRASTRNTALSSIREAGLVAALSNYPPAKPGAFHFRA